MAGLPSLRRGKVPSLPDLLKKTHGCGRCDVKRLHLAEMRDDHFGAGRAEQILTDPLPFMPEQPDDFLRKIGLVDGFFRVRTGGQYRQAAARTEAEEIGIFNDIQLKMRPHARPQDFRRPGGNSSHGTTNLTYSGGSGTAQN